MTTFDKNLDERLQFDFEAEDSKEPEMSPEEAREQILEWVNNQLEVHKRLFGDPEEKKPDVIRGRTKEKKSNLVPAPRKTTPHSSVKPSQIKRSLDDFFTTVKKGIATIAIGAVLYFGGSFLLDLRPMWSEYDNVFDKIGETYMPAEVWGPRNYPDNLWIVETRYADVKLKYDIELVGNKDDPSKSPFKIVSIKEDSHDLTKEHFKKLASELFPETRWNSETDIREAVLQRLETDIFQELVIDPIKEAIEVTLENLHRLELEKFGDHYRLEEHWSGNKSPIIDPDNLGRRKSFGIEINIVKDEKGNPIMREFSVGKEDRTVWQVGEDHYASKDYSGGNLSISPSGIYSIFKEPLHFKGKKIDDFNDLAEVIMKEKQKE